MRKALLTLVLNLLPLLCLAQKGMIKGTVFDPVKERGVEKVLVTLTRPDGILVDTVRTKYVWDTRTTFVNGGKMSYWGPDETQPATFTFSSVDAGDYIIKVEADGCEPDERRITTAFSGRDNAYRPAVFNLRKRARVLSEAVVTGTMLKFVHHGDTLVYNAAAIQLEEGDMLGNLIQKLPGAQIDNNGNISVNGRRIESLLINGKDFFNGNIDQALAALPAYTVDKIKAYEKQGERSLTAGLDMKDKKYVMDVRLKRDYNKVWVGNVFAAGGTDSRYRLLANVGRFDDRQSVNVLAQTNNVNERSTMWDRQIGNRTIDEGIVYTRSAIANYHFEQNQNLNFGLSAWAENFHTWSGTTGAAETYLEGGNTYSRNTSAEKSVKTKLSGSANLSLRPMRGFYVASSYQVNYDKNRERTSASSASYLQNPDRLFRANPLDSTFLLSSDDERLTHYVQSLLREQTCDRGHTLTHQASLEVQKKVGSDLLTVRGELQREDEKRRNYSIYDLRYPGGTAADDYRHRFLDRRRTKTQGSGTADYTYNYRSNDSIQGSLMAYYSIRRTIKNDDSPLYRLDALADYSADRPLTFLPSTRAALLGTLNYADTYYSHLRETLQEANVVIDHKFRLRNHSFMQLRAEVPLQIQHQTLGYERYATRYPISRTGCFLNPQLSFTFHPKPDDPDGQKMSIRLNYDTNGYMTDLVNFLTVTDASDPLHVSRGNPDLKNTRRHQVQLSISRNWREANGYVHFFNTFTTTHNDVAMLRTYNRATGASTSMPVNIDGNWRYYGYVYFNKALDKKQRWGLSANTSLSFNHSRDLNYWDTDHAAADGASAASTVRTLSLTPDLTLYYAPNGKHRFSLGVTPGYQYITGDRSDFTTIHAWNVRYSLSAYVSLPWSLKYDNELSATSRYGYSDRSLNDSRLIWNMRLTREFRKRGLSFYAEAHDLLHQNKLISNDINAQGRTESYVRTLPAYFMFGLTWKFSKVPGKKAAATAAPPAADFVLPADADIAG